MYTYLKVIIFCAIASLAASGIVLASDVSLDTDFGVEGMVITKLGFRVDQATSIVVQEDGKIVVAGTSDNGLGSKIAVIRYLPDGTVDQEFLFTAGGSLGSVHTDDTVNALALTEDGSILLGGMLHRDGRRQGVVFRIFSDGRLDVGYGDGGIAAIADDDRDSEILDLIIDNKNRVNATGYVEDDGKEYPFVARFDSNGQADVTFSEDGITSDSRIPGRGEGIVVLEDGSPVIGGVAVNDENWKGLYIGRFQENGEPESQFGDEGRVVWFHSDEQVIAHDIDLTAANKLVLAGAVEISDNSNRIMLARFDERGQIDTQFSENGILVHDIGLDSRVYRLVVLPDDQLLAAGYQQSLEGSDMIIIRYPISEDDASDQPDQTGDVEMEFRDGDDPIETIKISTLSIEEGSMDRSVAVRPPSQSHEAEIITTTLEGSDEVSRDLALAGDGSIYTAGAAGDESNSGFMVAKYSGLVGDGYPVGGDRVTSTQYYRIGTMPVTNVTRVSATTGGNIVLNNNFSEEECRADCEETCADEADSTTCISECQSGCQLPVVTQRGIVFSVDPNPEFDGSVEAVPLEDNGSGDGGTGNGDSGNSDGGTNNSAGSRKLFGEDDYFVREGQTDDGEDIGTYTSEIEAVNPQTVYYVRAYAVLSDGSVIYGNEYVFKTNDSCFIATAAFGSIDMFGVRMLREFRDRYLLTSKWGRSLVTGYYTISPPLADGIADRPLLRLLTVMFLIPVMVLVTYLLYSSFVLHWVTIALFFGWMLSASLKRRSGIIND